MTVADNTSRNQYTATSGQTVFAYTFEIVDKGDIVVLQNGTTLSEGTNYTVSGVGAENGGNITLTVGATAGDILTLYRDMPYARTQNYTNSGDFLASEVNSDFDNLWLAGEQTNRSFSQSIRKPITDSDSISMELPEAASRTNSFLTFDSTGAVSVESLSTGTGPTVIGRQQFTGDGTTTVFTLAATSSSAAAVIYIDGVYQEQETYTVVGTTLTFTEAPPTNASIEVLAYKITDVGTTDANSVTYTPAGTGAVQTTVQTKLRESVSVKDFGAVGDGVTDDTAAIQAAMDYANALYAESLEFPKGLQYPDLMIPSGIYVVSDTLHPTTTDGRGYPNLVGAVPGSVTIEWRDTSGTPKPLIDLYNKGENFNMTNIRTYVDDSTYTLPSVWVKSTGFLDHDANFTGCYFGICDTAWIQYGGVTNANLHDFRGEATNSTGIRITNEAGDESFNRLLRLQNWTMHARNSDALDMSSIVHISLGTNDSYTVHMDGQRIEIDFEAVSTSRFDFVKVDGATTQSPAVNLAVDFGGLQTNLGAYTGTLGGILSSTTGNIDVGVQFRNFRPEELDEFVSGNISNLADWPATTDYANKVLNFNFATSANAKTFIRTLESERLEAELIGVGTDSPVKEIHVSNTGNPAIRVQDTDGTNQFSQIGHSNGAFVYLSRNNTSNGIHKWESQTNVATTEIARFDANQNFLLGGTNSPAPATKSFAIFNGVAPTSSVTDGCLLYAEDVSSSSELKVRDEAGNVTTLSPHNFELIPEGPSEDMAWSYYSEKNGKRINVDMLRLARLVEQISGEKIVFED